MRDYLTVEEVCDYLRMSRRQLYKMVANGELPCTKVTGKWLFPRAVLDRWIMSGLPSWVISNEQVVDDRERIASDASVEPLILCPTCAVEMRLTGVNAESRAAHRDIYTFACESCGRTEARGLRTA